MVTNNKSDWDMLKKLSTRTITLYKLTDVTRNCQLIENNFSDNRQAAFTEPAKIILNESHNYILRHHLLKIFQQ
jgi:hypothetical protein